MDKKREKNLQSLAANQTPRAFPPFWPLWNFLSFAAPFFFAFKVHFHFAQAIYLATSLTLRDIQTYRSSSLNKSSRLFWPMREFGNKGLQVSTESTKNSSSSTSNESFSVDPSVSKTNNAANLSSHNSNKKRAHSGHSKSHTMPHESNDTGNKRKEVSGITRPDLQRSVPTFLSKLYKWVTTIISWWN